MSGDNCSLPGVTGSAIRFKVSIRKPGHARVCVHLDPNFAREIESQLPMFHWSVRQLADITERKSAGVSVGDRETNCIPIMLRREMRTCHRVTKVAEFPYVLIG